MLDSTIDGGRIGNTLGRSVRHGSVLVNRKNIATSGSGVVDCVEEMIRRAIINLRHGSIFVRKDIAKWAWVWGHQLCRGRMRLGGRGDACPVRQRLDYQNWPSPC